MDVGNVGVGGAGFHSFPSSYTPNPIVQKVIKKLDSFINTPIMQDWLSIPSPLTIPSFKALKETLSALVTDVNNILQKYPPPPDSQASGYLAIVNEYWSSCLSDATAENLSALQSNYITFYAFEGTFSGFYSKGE